MNHADAVKLLDMVREGQPIPPEVIAEALFLTGDAAAWLDVPAPQVEQFVDAMRRAGFL
jgi:hypothetical protein